VDRFFWAGREYNYFDARERISVEIRDAGS
jgi:hypothetical protein